MSISLMMHPSFLRYMWTPPADLPPDTCRGQPRHLDHAVGEFTPPRSAPVCLSSQYEALRGKFPASFFRSHAPVAQSKKFRNAREVMDIFRLKPAEYLIVPSTFDPNQTASFVLTIVYRGEALG